MNAKVTIENNAYERIAINLAELLDEAGLEQEESLYQLLTSAYQTAYQKAAEAPETRDLLRTAAG
jgi:hypothetical protein